MSGGRVFNVSLARKRNYEYVARFEGLPEAEPLVLDEPAPLGDGHGPNAASLLAAAIGNCLAASLQFCLIKTRADLDGITAEVAAHVTRTESGRFRVSRVEVELDPRIGEDDLGRLQRCETLFEDFCTVTESVRRGIPVNVTVKSLPRVPA